MSSSTLAIVVDADACPVKAEITETAAEFGVPVCMVASYDHRLSPQRGVHIVQVDPGSQSADLHIANRVSKGDVVVTADFGLACIVMAKGAIAISPRGEQYTDENIDYLMDRRHEGAKRRRAGGRSKGPRAMSADDRRRFQQKLTKVLQVEQEKLEL